MTLEAERLYLYAIVDGAADALANSALLDAAAPAGLGDAPVWLLPIHTLAAVVGPVDVKQLKDTAMAAQAHEQVVEWFMARQGTLPVRFGAVFSNAAALVEALDPQYATIDADLRRLAGRVEIGLRILWDGAAMRAAAEQQAPPAVQETGEEAGQGLRYMQQRLREAAIERNLKQAAETLAQQCRQRLAPHAETVVTRILATEGIPVSAALLVARGGVDDLVTEIAQFQRELHPLHVICTGPWPPYHFVSTTQGGES